LILSVKTIEEPARQIPLYGEYEVAVLGGGPAGIAAAVAAARAGRRTLLIERYGFLVSGACFAMGEAAGTAAALALSRNTIPRDIAMEKLQHALKQQGAFIGRDQSVPVGL
jgi:flavin-dependent dehydrogenase